MPNTEVIEKWVTALESGEYEQTQARLHKRYPSGNVGHCCLGVLCDLAVKEGVIPEPTYRREGGEVYVAWYGTEEDNTDLALPASVVRWAGLDDIDPNVEYLHETVNSDGEDVLLPEEDTLATLNDGGKSFPGIAQLIRDNFLTEK